MSLRCWTARFGVALALLAFAGGALCLSQAQYTAHRPLAITACGPSTDAATVSVLSTRLHLDHVFDGALKPDQLPGFRTLVIVIGGSVNGPGGVEAGQTGELLRIRALLAKAKQLSIGVIAVHVGGESRRGTASDRLIEAVIDQSDYLIVTEAGNRDGFFTRAAQSRTLPLVIVDEAASVGRELKAVLSDQ